MMRMASSFRLAQVSMNAARLMYITIASLRVGARAVSLIVIACLAITTMPCPTAAQASRDVTVEGISDGDVGGDQQPERSAASVRHCIACPCHVAFEMSDVECVDAPMIAPEMWSATIVRTLQGEALYPTFRPPKKGRDLSATPSLRRQS